MLWKVEKFILVAEYAKMGNQMLLDQEIKHLDVLSQMVNAFLGFPQTPLFFALIDKFQARY